MAYNDNICKMIVFLWSPEYDLMWSDIAHLKLKIKQQNQS